MKICPLLCILHYTLAKDFFPDKKSVITNENLAFYQREDFYMITVPCATAALFLICCVLCCTLYAREGVCHLFDVPDELHRRASGEHFLTVDEFLELERRHRLGLPVDSLLELQQKRRSEAEGALPQGSTDNAVVQEYVEQPPYDASVTEYPYQETEYDAFNMSGPSATKLSSSLTDLRSAQPQLSTPRTRRSLSLEHPITRDMGGIDGRPGQDIVPQDTPASPGASPMRCKVTSPQQGGEFPRKAAPGYQRYQDPRTRYGEDRLAEEPIPIPLNAAEDIKRMPIEDAGYPVEHHRPGQFPDNVGADRGYLHRSDPERSTHIVDRGYGAERDAAGPSRPADKYNQWSSGARPLDGELPLSEAHRRSLKASSVERRAPGGMAHDRFGPSPLDLGADQHSVDRHGAIDGRRYSGHQQHGSVSASALVRQHVPSTEGTAMTPYGVRVYHGGYEPESPMSARAQVHPQKEGRDGPHRDSRENLQRGVREDLQQHRHSSEEPIHQAEPIQRRASKQYEHSSAVSYLDQNRHGYTNFDTQQRTVSGRQPTVNGHDYPPQDPDQQLDRLPRDAQIRTFDESREIPGIQRYSFEGRGTPLQHKPEHQKHELQHKSSVAGRISQAYDYVDQGYPVRSDAMDHGYWGADIPPRTPSRLPLSRQLLSRSSLLEKEAADFGRRPDGHSLPAERNTVDPFGRIKVSIADAHADRGGPPSSGYIGRQQAEGSHFVDSHQWITGADGRQYLVPVQARLSATAPSTSGHQSGMQSPRMAFRTDVPEGSRIFGQTAVPLGIYGGQIGMLNSDERERQQVYEDRIREDSGRYRSGWREADEKKGRVTDPRGRGQDIRDEQQPSAKPSGLLHRVRSVSVSRMSHSLRQMVAGVRRPSSRSRSEEPRELASGSLRGSAAWLLHRIRSLRGVSEQPAVASGSGQRRRQERHSDRRIRSHRRQDSPDGSEGGVSGAADWPSSGEDLEEGEYISPSRRDGGEESRHPTPQPDKRVDGTPGESLPTESYKQSPKQTAENEKTKTRATNMTTSERQPSPKEEPVQYVLEEHGGRKRIISVTADRPEIDHFPTSKALEPHIADKRAASDSSDRSDEEMPKKKGHKKRKDKSNAKYKKSDDPANVQTKRKKTKSKKKKKKHSHKRSRSSRSPSSSSSSSYEGSTRKSKRRKDFPYEENDQSDSEESELPDESPERPYDNIQNTDEANDRPFSSSAPREGHRSVEQRRYQSPRDTSFTERTNRGQRWWRPRPSSYQQRYEPRRPPAAARSRWESASPVRERPQTPPDREPTPERGRSELNRYGQPRHRPVVFQNESLRAFVSQPARRASEQRGRPPRRGRGGLPAALRWPFQTNQSFMPWQAQQYPDSPERGRATGTPPGRLGPRTPPLPAPSSPRPGYGSFSPSTTPPRPPPRSIPARVDPRTRPARGDPRLYARIRAAEAERECRIRRAVYGETSQEDVGCMTLLMRLFDE